MHAAGLVVFAATAAMLAGAACGRVAASAAPAPTAAAAAAPAPPLDGVTWQVTGYDDGQARLAPPVAGTTLTLAFAGGSVSGTAGCNGFRGTYARDGQRLTLERIASTRKACPGDGVMAQEQAYLAALARAASFRRDRDVLTLEGGDGRPVVTARPRPPATP